MNQQRIITDFIKAAVENGACDIWAALPVNHPLVANRTTRQIRKIKDVLAVYWDELGNKVCLTTELRVIQH
jgi:hypothetical protein